LIKIICNLFFIKLTVCCHCLC